MCESRVLARSWGRSEGPGEVLGSGLRSWGRVWGRVWRPGVGLGSDLASWGRFWWSWGRFWWSWGRVLGSVLGSVWGRSGGLKNRNFQKDPKRNRKRGNTFHEIGLKIGFFREIGSGANGRTGAPGFLKPGGILKTRKFPIFFGLVPGGGFRVFRPCLPKNMKDTFTSEISFFGGIFRLGRRLRSTVWPVIGEVFCHKQWS